MKENKFAQHRYGIWALLALAVLVALTAGGRENPLGPPVRASSICHAVVAPNGSESFTTVQQLVNSLQPGETGCLRAATYVEDVTVTAGGSEGNPIRIRSYPGERALLIGRLWISDSANFVTFSGLDLDGQNANHLPSPTINGDDVVFSHNDVTSSGSSSCFALGVTTYGRAFRTVIEHNRIHGCTNEPDLAHGVSIEHATDVRITENQIWSNGNRGIQLYPDAQETYIAGNIIDGNGEGVSLGNGGEPDHDCTVAATSGTTVEHNIISNSKERWNIESSWQPGCLVGTGNWVRHNCLWPSNQDPYYNSNGGITKEEPRGFTTYGNLVADPLFVNQAGKDFRLQNNSLCQTPFGNSSPGLDSDGDGCEDKRELGSDPRDGGLRDPSYFWDFYDVWTHPSGWQRDKVINVFDILGVAARFGPGPAPPPTKQEAVALALKPPTSATGYHIAFDRGPDNAPPDGVITILDILAVASQFGHDCT